VSISQSTEALGGFDRDEEIGDLPTHDMRHGSNRALKVESADAGDPSPERDAGNAPPPGPVLVELEPQPAKEDQKGEFDRPETRVEQNVPGQAEPQDGPHGLERVDLGDRRAPAVERVDEAVQCARLGLPCDGRGEEHDPGGQDEVIVGEELRERSGPDHQAGDEEQQGNARDGPGYGLVTR
jgi:hypothetical protein